MELEYENIKYKRDCDYSVHLILNECPLHVHILPDFVFVFKELTKTYCIFCDIGQFGIMAKVNGFPNAHS